MPAIQYLLIVLIISHLVMIIFMVFDVQGVFPIFVSRCRCDECPTNPEALNLKQKPFSVKNVRCQNTTTPEKKYRRNLGAMSIEDRWRHLLSTVRNMWLFLHHQFVSLLKIQLPHHAIRIVNYLEESGVEYYRVISSELSQLMSLLGYLETKNKQATLLGETVQNRIDDLQNPEYCDKAKVLQCKLTNKHGFASSLHDVLWCFVKAYHENAFLLLDIKKWHYEIGKWEDIFLPLTRSCAANKFHNIERMSLPGGNSANARRELKLLPNDLGSSIVSTVDQPFAWWYGQFMKYIMRLNQKFRDYVALKKKEIGFVHPVVGIHVRRTDKIGREAVRHDLEEYMYFVEDYYLRLELVGKKQERRVFIASDDPDALSECNARYRRYTCLGFPEIAVLASNLTGRYSNSSLWGIMLELTLLAESDFLVCTFSSGFCRIAYELMHAIHPDAPSKVHSLDVEYFYAWQMNPDRIVLYDHIPKIPQELRLQHNDILRKKDENAIGYEAVHGKYRSGLAEGVQIRSKKSGLFPIFKTMEHYTFNGSSYFIDK